VKYPPFRRSDFALTFRDSARGAGERREFNSLLCSWAASWPLAAHAQQAGKLPTIGFLGVDPVVWGPWTDAFVGRLRELGWIERRTIAIEYRWTEGHTERNSDIAAEFVRLNVDIIVTFGTAVPAVKRATTTIPIVFTIAQDPVGGGLVTNLARPGGNVTGLSIQATDVAGKRLQFLRELLPRLRRLALLWLTSPPRNLCWRWVRSKLRLVR
jgi:ABC transporter substrate binding protein